MFSLNLPHLFSIGLKENLLESIDHGTPPAKGDKD